MKKLIIAIALLAAVSHAQSMYVLRLINGTYIGPFPGFQACYEAQQYWGRQGYAGMCEFAR